MNSYNEAYKSYYDTIRGKMSIDNKKENLINSSQDVYPVKTQVRNRDYSYNRSINRPINRSTNNPYNRRVAQTNSNKKIRYIDKLILRIIVASLILVSLYSLKVNPNKQANKVFEICKENVSKEMDYSKVIEYVKIKVAEFSNKINIDEYLKL